MNILKTIATLLTAAVLLAACGGNESPTDDSKATQVPNATGKGYVLSTAIWPSWDIDVCWDMSDAQFAATAGDRETVRKSIASTWEAASRVRFNDWGICSTSRSQRVRITVKDVNPMVTNLGLLLNNRVGGVVLNFTFDNYSPSFCQRDAQTHDYCVALTAVHEFGHALGFSHEQNRPDTPATCKDAPQGPSGDTLIGAWDGASIMNYCSDFFRKGSVSNTVKLSDTDIQMVQSYYGVPLPPVQVYPGDLSSELSVILDDDL